MCLSDYQVSNVRSLSHVVVIKRALSEAGGAGCGVSGLGARRLRAARNTIYGHENSAFVRLVEAAATAGRGGPITTLIYIPRERRSLTFHEVSSS